MQSLRCHPPVDVLLAEIEIKILSFPKQSSCKAVCELGLMLEEMMSRKVTVS